MTVEELMEALKPHLAFPRQKVVVQYTSGYMTDAGTWLDSDHEAGIAGVIDLESRIVIVADS